MHAYTTQNSENQTQADDSSMKELFMGDVFQAALENDLSTEVVHFPKGSFIDVGIPANFAKFICTDVMNFK